MHKIKSILFVCTGNSCRSIMAEGLLKKYLKDEGMEGINVQSAGVCAVDGMSPTAETIEVMRKAGVDVSRFKSKCITDELIKKADLILVMAACHMDSVIRMAPEAVKKTHLLKQYGLENDTSTCEELDVPDPIGKPVEFYQRVSDTIKREIERIVEIIR